jgi:hypothetical protein
MQVPLKRGAIGRAVLRIYFNRLGKSIRVKLMTSSGDRSRDLKCISYCENMVIPIPRLGSRKMGDLWRQVTIEAGANLD